MTIFDSLLVSVTVVRMPAGALFAAGHAQVEVAATSASPPERQPLARPLARRRPERAA
jgi:hypothetical protein